MAWLYPAGAGDEVEEEGLPGQVPWLFDCESLYVVPGVRAFGNRRDGHTSGLFLSCGSRQNRVIREQRDPLYRLIKVFGCVHRFASAGKGIF